MLPNVRQPPQSRRFRNSPSRVRPGNQQAHIPAAQHEPLATAAPAPRGDAPFRPSQDAGFPRPGWRATNARDEFPRGIWHILRRATRPHRVPLLRLLDVRCFQMRHVAGRARPPFDYPPANKSWHDARARDSIFMIAVVPYASSFSDAAGDGGGLCYAGMK